MTIEPLPPSSDLLEFVDDQRIEGGQGDNWQEPLVGMIRLIDMARCRSENDQMCLLCFM